ncbi:MAG: carbamoyltransferase HypF [Candidatus Nitrosocaldus sp.]|nr:carbamoyltransferase HypF [Candidatus Nitrosocaldus sp.]
MSDGDVLRYTITVHGRVQGVGFRPFIYRVARANNLHGYVRNMGDGSVEIVVEGHERDMERFLHALEHDRPPLAYYERVDVKREKSSSSGSSSGGSGSTFHTFSILDSTHAHGTTEPSIPPDVATCDRCVSELFDASNRRYGYFFITCTDCGPRFTMIRALPYDRANTSMDEFPLCDECYREYMEPTDRRFHNESIACPNCGPRLYLIDGKGGRIDGDPLAHASRYIEQGCIVAVKGIGGFHIMVSAYDTDAIARLRRGKGRGSKPFAVMARSVDVVRNFALLDGEEERLLRSYARPIVLLRKSGSYNLSPLVSNLSTIGVMLPYTALHHLIFSMIGLDAIVVTSANVSDEPLMIDEGEVLSLGFVDYILTHDRRIINRCDDSVLMVNDGSTMMIRRARGYVPSPIHVDAYSSRCILALGAHLNVTASILFRDKIVVSQHIGDMDSLKAYTSLRDTAERLCGLLGIRPDLITCDLHPSIPTTGLAYSMAREYGCGVERVQHHHAHASTLMLEHRRREMVCITCDGNGYGEDGNVWGGEVFVVDGSKYERVAHLMEQPMVGGDLAAYYPLRMVAGMLYTRGVDGVEDYLYSRCDTLPYGRAEMDAILDVVRKGRYIKTTSTGRVLDAVAFVLGVVDRRGYEGEPAMMLESVACDGEDVLRLEPRVSWCALDTGFLLEEVFHNRRRFHARDIAYSAHTYIAEGLAALALDSAREHGIDTIGISGGVAYNRIITRLIRRRVEEHGLRFVCNSSIPAGDAGISIGQAFYTLAMTDHP